MCRKAELYIFSDPIYIVRHGMDLKIIIYVYHNILLSRKI